MSLTGMFEIASATDPGRVRSHNEDSIATDPEIGLAVLADGMGGYNAGEVASGIAVAMIARDVRKALKAEQQMRRGIPASGPLAAPNLLRQHAAHANRTIYETAQNQRQYRGMGTTLVMALFYDGQVAVGHIGDSRLYRMRDDHLSQLTRDHSLLQEQIDSGMLTREQARHSRNRGIITRAVGIEPQVETEIHVHDTQPDDIYLLCSDGLNDMVSDDDIQLTIGALGANLPLVAQQLVQQANDNGGRDNISVILIKVRRNAAVRVGWLNKIIKWARA